MGRQKKAQKKKSWAKKKKKVGQKKKKKLGKKKKKKKNPLPFVREYSTVAVTSRYPARGIPRCGGVFYVLCVWDDINI